MYWLRRLAITIHVVVHVVVIISTDRSWMPSVITFMIVRFVMSTRSSSLVDCGSYVVIVFVCSLLVVSVTVAIKIAIDPCVITIGMLLTLRIRTPFRSFSFIVIHCSVVRTIVGVVVGACLYLAILSRSWSIKFEWRACVFDRRFLRRRCSLRSRR